MRKTGLKKAVALLLTVTVSFGGLTLEGKAATVEASVYQQVVTENGVEHDLESQMDGKAVIRELEEERTENSNTYLLADGSKKLVMYAEDVRYPSENGGYTDYNPELTPVDSEDAEVVADAVVEGLVSETEPEDYQYRNTEGDSMQYLPVTAGTDTPVLMTKTGYGLSFAPYTDGENHAFSGDSYEKSAVYKEAISDAYEQERLGKTAMLYANGDNSIKLRYDSMSNGIKETVTLKKQPESGSFLFLLRTKDMEAKLDHTGKSITFLDPETEQIVGGISSAFMNDATGAAYSEDITYSLTEQPASTAAEGVHTYLFAMEVSEAYLSDPARMYPVTIDPTATWAGSDKVQDTYVLKAQPAYNYYASGIDTFSVGNGSQGLFRTYMKIVGFGTAIDGKSVESAKLTVYENGNNAKGTVIQAKQVTETFAMNKITWNNKPANGAKVYASITSSGTSGTAKTFNLTTWARGMADGSLEKKGLVLMASNESTASTYVRFYGSRTADTTKRPKLVATYYDKPTAPTDATVSKAYLRAGDSLTVTWSGISSTALSHVQYRVANYNPETQKNTATYIDYSTSTKLGTAGSGSKQIVSSMNWPEGVYRIHIRGVDKNGIAGASKGKIVYVDKTVPKLTSVSLSPATAANNYSSTRPKVTWNASDTYFSKVQISIDGGKNFSDFSSAASGTKEVDKISADGIYNIVLRILDKAGNHIDKGFGNFYYDGRNPVISDLTVSPVTGTEVYSASVPSIYWKISDSTLQNISCKINGTEIGGQNLTAEDRVVPPADKLLQGKNTVILTATDKAKRQTVKQAYYYYDTVSPIWGITADVKNQTEEGTYSRELPVFVWSDITESNLKNVLYSVNGGAYQPCGNTLAGEAQLPISAFPNTGVYTLRFKIRDKAGNESNVKTFSYGYTTSDAYAYLPKNVTVREQVDGSTVVYWQAPEEAVSDDIRLSYAVYRGDTMSFSTEGMEPLVSGITENYAVLPAGEANKVYYYKVAVSVIDASTGNTIERTFSEEKPSVTIPAGELLFRTGNKAAYDTVTFETPNGSGETEKLGGNFLYTQTDFTLPAPQLPITLTRVYNSQSGMKGILGYGWTFSYEMTLCKSVDGSYYFRDGDGTVYSFTETKGDYGCKENPDLKLVLGEQNKITVKEDITYVFHADGRLDSIEEMNGTYTKLVYDTYGTIERIESHSTSEEEDTVTKIAVLSYTDSEEGGRLLTSIAAPDGMVMCYRYTDNRLTEAVLTGTKGGIISYKYGYDADGNLVEIRDAESNLYQIRYIDKKVSELLYPDGERYIITYGTAGGQATVVTKKNSSGAEITVTKVFFNQKGFPVKAIDENGREALYTYTESGLLAKTERKVIHYVLENNVVTAKEETVTEQTAYDATGNITEDVAEDGSKTVYEYENADTRAKGQPSKTIEYDALGNIIEEILYTYDTRRNCIKIVNKTDKTVSESSYDVNGNPTGDKNVELDYTLDLSTDEQAEALTAAEIEQGLDNDNSAAIYDTDGNPVLDSQTAGTVDSIVTATYDSCGRILTELDEKNRNVIHEYDEFGRCVQTTILIPGTAKETEQKEVETKTYNANGAVATETDKAGRVTSYTYDNRNRVIKKTITADGDIRTYTTTYSYENVEIFKAEGVTETVDNAYVETVTDSSGYEVSKQYMDRSGNTVRMKENGLFTDYTYDSDGKAIAVFSAGQTEGDAEGGQLAVTLYNKNGKETHKIVNPSYDRINESYQVTEQSVYTRNVYDENGNLTESYDGNNHVTKFTYDTQSRLIKVIAESGTDTENSRRHTYDIQTKDADGKIITTADEILSALGIKTRATVNGAGQVLSVTDTGVDGEITITTTYEYDTQGNQTKEIFADGSYNAYTYNLKNMIVGILRYNALNQLTGETTYTYDKEDRLSKMTDYSWSGKEKTVLRSSIYRYDKFGRLEAFAEIDGIENPTEEQVNAVKICYIYDSEDKLSEVHYPQTAVQYVQSGNRLKGIHITYNADRWITGIHAVLETENGEVTTPVREYGYHNDGKVSDIKDYTDFLKQGTVYVQKHYTYDVFDRVMEMYYTDSVTDDVRERYAYTYDKNSNILTERLFSNYASNTAGQMDLEKEYIYDNLDRLVQVKVQDNLKGTTAITAYTYDQEGNRLTKTTGNSSTIYSYNGLNQLTGAVETTDGTVTSNISYTYDANGCQIVEADSVKNRIVTNSYDTEGQLAEVQIYENGKLTLKQANQYNGHGQRIRKYENGVTTNYYYADGEVLYTTDSEGNLQTFQISGISDNVIATLRYHTGSNGKTGAESYIYNKDIRTSTTNIVNWNGDSVAAYYYDEFGKTKYCKNDNFYNEICYSGGIYDESTELYYLNARYYDPENGRFLTQDTDRGEDGVYGTWHLYVYCANNPITYTDPSGHNWLEDAWNGVKDGFGGFFSNIKDTGKSFVKDPFGTAWSCIKSSVNPFNSTFKWVSVGADVIKGDFYSAGYQYGGQLGEASLVAGGAALGKVGSAIGNRAGKVGGVVGKATSKVGKTIGKVRNKRAYCKNIKLSSKSMHQLGDHFNKHGKEMGYKSKKAYEKGARQFVKKVSKSSKTQVFEGEWNGRGKTTSGRLQIILRYQGKQAIIDKKTGQLINFYQGTELKGFKNVKEIK